MTNEEMQELIRNVLIRFGFAKSLVKITQTYLSGIAQQLEEIQHNLEEFDNA